MSQPGKAQGTIAVGHIRHRPGQTLLYQLVQQHYPEFEALMAAQGTLAGILADDALHHRITRDELIQRLFGK